MRSSRCPRPRRSRPEFAESPQGDFLIRPVEPFHLGGTPALFYERGANRSAAAVLYVDTSAPAAHSPRRGFPARGVAGPSLAAHHSARAVRPRRNSAASAAIRDSSRAGGCTRNRSARSSACTATPRRNSRASRTSWPVPRVSRWTPACTDSAGAASRRSSICARRCRRLRKRRTRPSTASSRCRPRRWIAAWGSRVFRGLRAHAQQVLGAPFRPARLSCGADRRRRHAARHPRVRREPLVERPALTRSAFHPFRARRAASRRLAAHRESRPRCRPARRRATTPTCAFVQTSATHQGPRAP